MFVRAFLFGCGGGVGCGWGGDGVRDREKDRDREIEITCSKGTQRADSRRFVTWLHVFNALAAKERER